MVLPCPLSNSNEASIYVKNATRKFNQQEESQISQKITLYRGILDAQTRLLRILEEVNNGSDNEENEGKTNQEQRHNDRHK
jgi:hypothetical protein